MDWQWLDTWIVLTAFFAAAACALPGCYLILRRMSMMGDAISHAVLPGIAIAFLVTASRASAVMFVGAVTVGVLTAVLTQWLHRSGRVESSASLGVVFTALFAVGLLLIDLYAGRVHLDLECVLHGDLVHVPLYTVSLLGMEIPQATLMNGAMLLVNGLLIGLFYKELKIASFDPSLATTLGIHAGAMHYMLMALVAATTVAAFESVGSILVIAMLIVPGAAAYLLTQRLGLMLVLAVVIAGVSAVLGHVGAIALPPLIGFTDTQTSGMMTVVAGLILVLAILFSPGQGWVWRWARRWRLAAEPDLQVET